MADTSWAAFDLDGRRANLDAHGLEISEHQSSCLASRKRLAETTKDFRRTTDAVLQRKKVGPLLSAYQKEIDKLTKRARSSEQFFLKLYKELYELPDPVPLLRRSADSDSLRRECAGLREEVAALEKELSGLTNQDITIRELEDRLADSAAEGQRRVAEAVAKREAEILEATGRTGKAIARQEAEATGKLEVAERKAAEHQKALDHAQSELFELRALLEEKEASYQAEASMLAEEATRSSMQVATLQREAQQLREQLADERAAAASLAGSQLRASPHSSGADERISAASGRLDDRSRAQYESEVSRLTEASALLRSEMAKLRSESQTLREEQGVERAAWDRRLGELESQLADASTELQARPTSEAHSLLQRQLDILQAAQFNTSAKSADDSPVAEHANPTEQALLARLRKLEADASGLRVELSKSETALEDASRRALLAEERLEDQRLLVVKLEAEAISLHQSRPTSAARKAESERDNLAEREYGSSPQATQLMQQATVDAESAALSSALALEGEAENSCNSSMLQIMREQRDRFRARMLELEAERGDLMSRLVKHRNSSEQLRADNIQLFERIKFLQSFRGGGHPGSLATSLNANQMSEVEAGVALAEGSEPAEARYAALYEQRSNPFSRYRKRFLASQRRKLTVIDRVTLDCTHFFLLNKYTRGFLFCYILALHLLVFGISWVTTHRTFKQCL